MLGVLNSSLINHLYTTKFLNVAIKAEYLKDTPIPCANAAQEKQLTDLVRKILAAKQAGIKTVILPARNRKDISEVPAEAKKSMKFAFVKNTTDALKIALKTD